ncbi:MAG: hypothetical protein AAFX02_09760 [Pseudomonadota bacterium]
MIDFIQDTIEMTKLRMDVSEAGEDSYRCVMSSPHGEMERTVTMRPGYGAPSLEAVLHFYAERAQLAGEYASLEEWAEEFSHDPEAPESIEAHEKLMSDRSNLRQMLGPYAFDALMTGLSISQAIERARPR